MGKTRADTRIHLARLIGGLADHVIGLLDEMKVDGGFLHQVHEQADLCCCAALGKSICRTMRKPSYARMDSGISARSVGGAK